MNETTTTPPREDAIHYALPTTAQRYWRLVNPACEAWRRSISAGVKLTSVPESVTCEACKASRETWRHVFAR